MPLDGTGQWVPAGSSVNPAVTVTTISSTDWNALLADLKTALSTAMFKDGQATPTANIKMSGFKLTGLAASSTAGDAVRYEQVFTATALTDQATIAWDASLAPVATVTLTASRIMGAPTNLKTGGTYTLIVTQNSTGGWALTWNAVFKAFGGGTMPQPETTLSTSSALTFVSPDGTNLICTQCAPFIDSNYFVRGSADPTKKVRFEVDGLTTATTRTITPPDFDMNMGNGEIIAVGRNIAARTNSSTPNTKIDITADEICVRDSNGTAKLLSSVSGTVDFGTVGANGLDASTQASSTWYYGWVIWNPATNTTALLGSLSNSAPTMPSGYTFKALVTAARSDGSTHFIKYRQFGNRVHYEAVNNVLSSAAIGAVETTVSLSSFIPPNAFDALVSVYGQATANGGGSLGSSALLRFITGSNWMTASINQNNTSGSSSFGYQAVVPNVSQQLFVLFSSVTNFANSSYSVDVIGFKLPLGGE